MRRALSPNDFGAASEVIEYATEALEDYVDINEMDHSPVCFQTTTAVALAAAELGILATQELHIGHSINVFADLKKEPTPDDPILCMTWGQFTSADDPRTKFEPYFGKRRDIKQLLGNPIRQAVVYGTSYSALSALSRTDFATDPETRSAFKHAKAKKAIMHLGLVAAESPIGIKLIQRLAPKIVEYT